MAETKGFSADQIYTTFIVKRTQVEMLADRGYLIPEDEIQLFLDHPNVSRPTAELLTQFIKRYTSADTKMFSRENMTQSYTNENDKVTYVYFAPLTVKDKQGIGIVTTFIDTANELAADVAIIITGEDFTSDARKSLEALTEPIIQVFFDFQLYVNPTSHYLVPKHTKLSEDERRELLTKSKIQPRQALTLSIDDPIVQYYGWLPGDLIRVDRFNLATNKTMVQRSIVYRMVGRSKIEQKKPATKKKTQG